MPDNITNSQINQGTISNDGTSRREALKPESHFFLQIGNEDNPGYAQLANETFGVKSQTVFQNTAVVNFTGSKDVYAICKGQVFIQPNASDSNKVNLILRPFNQPIKGIAIKYFVYRGLNKSDFFNLSNGKIAGSHSTGTAFCQYIWKEFNAFYGEEDTEPTETEFMANFIGYPLDDSQLPTDLIDEYFFKISKFYEDEVVEENLENPNFEFPMVTQGMHLGTASESVGLDIVLSDGDYYTEGDPNPFQLDLAFARANIFSLDASTGSDYEKKLVREACTRFIDPAAFYGMHGNGYGKLFYNDAATPLETPTQISKIIEPFLTSNFTYLYIQSNRQRSYNFYGNYTHPDEGNNNNLKIGQASTNLAETIFGQSSWPLLTIDNATDIFLQLITDNHNDAALYAFTGFITSANEESYVRGTSLLQAPPQDENSTVDTHYAQTIHFTVDKNDSDEPLANYIQLIYEGTRLVIPEANAPVDETPRVYYLKDIDDIFGLLNAQPFLTTKSNDESPYVTEHLLTLINFPNAQRDKDIGLIKTRRIEDKIKINEDENLARVTYETLLHNIKNANNTFSRTNNAIADGKGTSGSTTYSAQLNNFYQPDSPYYLKTQVFTAGSQTITGLILQTTNGSLPTKKILGLTKDENDRIKTKAITLNNPKIYLKNTLYNENDNYISPENISYKTYEVLIIAENDQGEPQLYLPELAVDETEYTPIVVYCVDGCVFVSQVYGKYTPNLNFLSNSKLITKI